MSKLQDYKDRLEDLETRRRPWHDHWQEISEYVLPSHGFYATSGWQPNYGEKRTSKIIDGTATRAMRVLASGMQGGLTSPSRPWFRLGVADGDLMQNKAVKQYFDDCERRMYWFLSKTNYYQAVHAGYTEQAGFGQMVLVVEADPLKGVVFHLVTAGQYSLAEGLDGKIDTLFRRFNMTVRSLVDRFGKGSVSRNVREQYTKNALDEYVEVVHVITPRYNRDTTKDDNKNMPWAGCYFELGASDEEGFLEEKGYRSCPIIAPRWLTTGSDVYGRSPGMDVLPDVKMLQQMASTALRAEHKMVEPSVEAPASMKGRINMLPAGVSYTQNSSGTPSIRPIYEVNPNIIGALEGKIERVQQAIKAGLYNDLFLLPDQMRPGVTAYEISVRNQEKMVLLGPVVERQTYEGLDVTIDRVWDIMEEGGMLPDPPEEIGAMEVKVEYISLLAQVQKRAGTDAIQQMAGFAGQLAQLNPTVLDKLDVDESMDQLGDLIGAPAGIIRSDEEVKTIRDGRAQQQQQMVQQQMEAEKSKRAMEAIGGIKDLSQADPNNLAQIMGVGGEMMNQLGGGAPPAPGTGG